MTDGPRCPNHKVKLTDCSKGTGICPVSGAVFSYDADEAEKTKKLRLTNMGYVEEGDWKVRHVSGEDV